MMVTATAVRRDDDGPVPVRFTEDALAATFAERHAGTWRYVAAWGQWLTWSGVVWQREDTLQAFDLARLVCREAASRAGTVKLKAKLSSAATVSAVERLARSDRRHAAPPTSGTAIRGSSTRRRVSSTSAAAPWRRTIRCCT